MKFKLNRAFREASGELDGLVYRNVHGKVVVSRKPDVDNIAYSENQIAHRERFKQAAAYGKAALANPTVRALYEAAAKSKDIPVFAATIADYFNAPTIDHVDVLAYNGQVGDLISIMARDDFVVASVHVSIATDQGVTIESGNAIETPADSGQWVYTATNAVMSGTDVIINAVATDRPGGTAVLGKPRSI